jgi:hypothetical protein
MSASKIEDADFTFAKIYGRAAALEALTPRGTEAVVSFQEWMKRRRECRLSLIACVRILICFHARENHDTNTEERPSATGAAPRAAGRLRLQQNAELAAMTASRPFSPPGRPCRPFRTKVDGDCPRFPAIRTIKFPPCCPSDAYSFSVCALPAAHHQDRGLKSRVEHNEGLKRQLVRQLSRASEQL